jgi:NDP-sugar pyrophosphorylase family protein
VKIVIPMAGAGSRFAGKGSGLPKPLIQVAGRPLIEWSVRNLSQSEKDDWVFIVRGEHIHRVPELITHLKGAGKSVHIHALAEPTPSPLHTLDAARDAWLDAGTLLSTNCDQALAVPLEPWISTFEVSGADVGVLTVISPDAHFVHVELRVDDRVSRVAGKVAGNLPAAAGYYLFKSGAILAGLIDAALAEAGKGGERCVTDLIALALAKKMDVRAWSLGEL